MHLKKIELFGFKSFATKTEIIFEKGVTCVVGPNGCGKSNVSDAIRWVLGERSAKQLRGSSMEDVIFNGTDFRKPLSLAEVSLTIDNSNHLFPLEYDEVVLTRRIYRSGETEYLINKTPCRLKDIRELTMDTGLGSNAYSMIGQGKIDHVLNADPEERRSLIEEAAGIAKYKSKKEEALRKLERTENNLLRLNDIVNEVEKNIKYSERQARRAERYKEQLEELKRLETIKAFQELDRIKNEKDGIQSKTDSLSIEEQQNQLQIEATSKELQAKDSEFSNAEKETSNVETRRYRTKSSITAIDERLRYIKDTVQEIDSSATKMTDEIALARERLITVGNDIEKRETEALHFTDNNEDSFAKHAEFKAKIENISHSIEEYESYVTVKKQSAFECAKDISDVHNELNKIKVDLGTLLNRKERLTTTLEKLKTEKQEVCEKKNSIQSETTNLSAEIDSEQNTLQALKNAESSLEESTKRLQQEVMSLQSQKELLSSKIQTLKELGEGRGSKADSSHELLQEGKRSESPLYNLIYSWVEHLQIKEGYEQAIRAVLLEHINDIVIDDWDNAFKIIDFLRSGNYSNVGLLINKISSNPSEEESAPELLQHSSIIGQAKDFVTAPEHLHKLVNKLLQGVYIVRDFCAEDHSFLHTLSSTHRLVTTKGDIIGPGEYIRIVGNNNFNTSEALDPEALQNELEECVKNSCLLKQELDGSSTKYETLKSELRVKEEELQEKRVQLESKLHILENIQNQSSKLDEEIKLYEIEQNESGKDKIHLEQSEKEVVDKKLTLEKADAETKEKLNDETKELENKRRQKELLTMDWAKLDAEIKHLRETEKHFNETLALLKKESVETKARITRYEKELSDNSVRKNELLSEETGLVEQRQNLSKEAEIVESEASTTQSKRESLSRERTELSEKLNACREKVSEIKEKQHEIQMKSMELDYQSNALHERLQQTYKIDLLSFDRTTLQTDDTPTDEGLIETIEKLKKKVESLGTVNLLAIEEYDELKKRFEFLDNQRNDLVGSRESLLEAIRKINRTTRSLFIDTFKQVHESFREYYRTLFNGGHAELRLLDESHPLESGIDIVVRPPGKKLQNISLLSGGEKALTAIALLFALFKIKPSPFCLLDEVDAPLDEANIDRFLAILRHFTDSTQFIIITHNRKTISMGNCLYGITMEEAGISKVVSVKVGDTSETLHVPHDIMNQSKVKTKVQLTNK